MSHNFFERSLFDSFFGNGASGNVVVVGTVTLTTDTYYNNLTVNSGGVLITGGYRVFVRNRLRIESGGTIQYNAPPANGRLSGPAYGFVGTTNGYPTYGAFGVSGNEGGVVNHVGVSPNGAGSQLRGGGVHATSSVGWSAGKGGNATLNGANGGAGTLIANNWGSTRHFPNCITFKVHGFASGASFGSGPGGGSGACDAGGVNDWSGAGGHGGAAVGIVCQEISNDGTIECKGGKGGDAAGSVKAGGGGGGAGGTILITTRIATKVGTLDVSGGAGGNGVNGGANGNTGESGFTQVVLI